MTPELTALTFCGLLQMLQFLTFAVPANLELGPDYTTSPRDAPPKHGLSPRTARLQRAFANHFEALILFSLAVVVLTLSGQSTPVTQLTAWVFFGARVLYVPAYLLGWQPGRSMIWGLGWCATLVLLLAALL